MQKTLPARYNVGKIIDILSSRIEDGVYLVGSNIPNELQLCEEFEVSRYMMREAIRQLQERGLVERRKRAGTKVINRLSRARYGLDIEAADSLGRYLRHTDLNLVGAAEPLAAQPAEFKLDGDLADWSLLNTYRSVPGINRPISWSYIYIRKEYDGIADLIGQFRGGIYAMVSKKYDVAIKHVDIDVSASVFPEHIAGILKYDARDPALLIIRRFYSVQDRLIEVSVSYYPPYEFQYSSRINLQQ